LPAISTVHAVLDRHGLVTRGRRARYRAEGTTLSKPTQPNDLWCADYKGEFMLADRRYCYPLTVTDFASRYLLCCDRTITVTVCGRICIGGRKINLSQVFAGQNVSIKEVAEKIWLVTFMHYDLGFFDQEAQRVECAQSPFEAQVLPMCPERIPEKMVARDRIEPSTRGFSDQPADNPGDATNGESKT
jgi:hypothetical protein